jgi:hypothetical protein
MVKWGLYIVIVIYNLLDAWHTWLLLQVGAVELNPIFNYMAKYFGLMQSIIGTKIFMLGSLGILLYNYKKEI